MLITKNLIKKFNELFNKDIEKVLNEYNREQLLDLLKECKNKKNSIMLEESFNSYLYKKNYIYNFLLENIIKSYLLEIYPGRIKKKQKYKKTKNK